MPVGENVSRGARQYSIIVSWFYGTEYVGSDRILVGLSTKAIDVPASELKKTKNATVSY